MTPTLEVPFTALISPDKKVFLRPLLTFTLIRSGNRVSITGLLDSGSDVSVISYRIGLQLRAVWEDQPQLSRLSGNLVKSQTRGLVLQAQIGNFDNVDLVFAWVDTDNVPVLLGQVNFFDAFNVHFRRSERNFVLSRGSQLDFAHRWGKSVAE